MLTMTMIGANRDAWGYLMETVAKEHTIDRAESKASYYMENGTPAGVWAGAGAAALGLDSNVEITEAQLQDLFGEGKHPVTGKQLGRAFNAPTPVGKRIQARVAEIAQDPTVSAEEFELQAEQITQEEMSRSEKQSVAGFEFVFSPPKSVSTWWAMADPELKDQIRQAHHAAIQETISKLETDILRTRIGVNGVAPAHIQGITSALFDHWDSREGDPQLHTHMLVSNRVQGEDGRWRTIDSRWSLSPAVATAGEFYDSILMDELSARFGVEWTVQEVLERPKEYQKWRVTNRQADTPGARHQFALDSGTKPGSVKWQIAGIPHALNDEFSTRSKKLKASKDQLVAEYVKTHGHQPSARTVIRMRQAATLRTREAKKVRSLQDLTGSWRQRARQHVGDSFLFADRIKEAGHKRLRDYALWSFRQDDVSSEALQTASEYVLSVLATTRSTWSRTNAEANALRAIAHWRFRSAQDRNTTVKRIVELVTAAAVPLTPKNKLHTPYRFQTVDGESMFHPKARDLFTTAEVWDAEERLLTAGRTTDAARVSSELVDELLFTPTGTEKRVLSDDQAAAVLNVATSGRLVDVLVGPAGAGKTTSLEKLREIWEHQHGTGSVRGLAPTARAAEVLSESLGIVTENTAKWLHESAAGTAVKDGFDFQMHPGDLVIVDEASIAGTLALDELRAQAENAGAKLLLVGDWAQLAAVDAGGAFGLLASDRNDVAELHALHRFKEGWEADASKLLRLGKSTALDKYEKNKRLSWGLDEVIISEAVEAWKQDEVSGTSLLIAPTNEIVTRLNDVARQWRIDQGLVDDSSEIEISHGVASVGDRIVTRQNARKLRTDHDRWVKNNDEWTVAGVTKQGDIVATSGDERVILPAAYCRDHVQLAYATTAHRSQGRTVTTAHTIVDETASRETFYVAMTRGKVSNRAYVVVDSDDQLGDSASHGMTSTWREILERVIANRGGDISAHEIYNDELERTGSIRQLAAEYQTIIADVLEREYLPVLSAAGVVDLDEPDSPYLGPVLANLRRVEVSGDDVNATIEHLLTEREVGTARDKLAVLHYRLARHLGESEIPAHQKIAGIIEPAPHVDDVDIAQALRERELAIQLRAEALVDRALERDEPWIRELGTPIPGAEEQWRTRAVTVACYRELHGVDTVNALGAGATHTRNQERDRAQARNVLDAPVQFETSKPTM